MLHTLEPKRILCLAFTYCKHSSQSDDWLENSDNTLIWTGQTNQASGWRTAKNWSTLETTFRNNRYRVLIIYLHCCWMKKSKRWARDGKANLDARMSRLYWTKKSHVKSRKGRETNSRVFLGNWESTPRSTDNPGCAVSPTNKAEHTADRFSKMSAEKSRKFSSFPIYTNINKFWGYLYCMWLP